MSCPVCHRASANGVRLSTSEIVHAKCYSKLEDAFSSASKEFLVVSSRLKALRVELTKAQSLSGTIGRFFGGGGRSPSHLGALISAIDTDMTTATATLATARYAVSQIYDVLPDYPPDWFDRRLAVLKRDRVCKGCKSRGVGPMHVHHKIPLSRGGSNRLENLVALCERCHTKAHGVEQFTQSGEARRAVVVLDRPTASNTSLKSGPERRPVAVSDRMTLLTAAISSGKAVSFVYKKPGDEVGQRRTVTPKSFVRIPHVTGDESTFCLRGYCHLRNAERTFALKRMSGVKYA